MIDYKALKGDPTDNIPGIPGVGEKTAAKLVGQFGTLEEMYGRLDEVKQEALRQKLKRKLVSRSSQAASWPDSPRPCRSRSTWRRPDSPTTTAPRWSGSSASSNSGR